MKFSNVLEDILGNKPKIRILRYLINTKLELTGRRLAGVTNIHHRTVHNALRELSSLGIVIFQQSGKARLYKINSNNLLVRNILKPAFEQEKDILPKLIENIITVVKIKIISAIIFGSVASSSERPTSDIDVLFLVNKKEDKIKLSSRIENIEYDFILKYGNMLSSIVLTVDEFYGRLKNKDKLIQNIIQKGNSVYGKTVQEVLVGCQQK